MLARVLTVVVVAACGPPPPRVAPAPAADVLDPAAAALAERACAGYRQCEENGLAWREARAPHAVEDDDLTAAACRDTVTGLGEEARAALVACLDLGCHGGCDCVAWVERWGSLSLECPLGDNPADFVESPADD